VQTANSGEVSIPDVDHLSGRQAPLALTVHVSCSNESQIRHGGNEQKEQAPSVVEEGDD
jgi:hypothetical protein